MNRTALTFLAGLVFALGLGISGMTQPAKVLGFLDLAGQWDPSLAFVMAGAVGTHLLLLRLGRRRAAAGGVSDPVTAAAAEASAAPARLADARLLGGSALFGLGWGLVGLCPGPAVLALTTGLPAALAFGASMVAGMLLYRHGPLLLRRLRGDMTPVPPAAPQECA
jgi:uncharacterized protein